ncbi:hypothetical protein EST38_g6694 [Candolleomyces aberdarensis]|uniref:glycogenin glucosyltransferase n=1 Tax=Candolleomyces aberdarensis TaxID=2316362 RepID=A0A4Q2DHJ2_9AGAR|nr:hypothetical protein EST38_g6694 [Candolleomyces aberdarensis]
MASPYAFVTLISSDSYLPGALAQVAALRDLESDPNLTYVCLVTPETVDVSTIKLLRKTFDLVVGVEVLEDEDKRGLQLLGESPIPTSPPTVFRRVAKRVRPCPPAASVLTSCTTGRPDLATVLTKLHVFRLVQFSKIVFLDADVLPLRSLSHLFQLPHEFSAAPDVGWPDIFNSGVLVFTPGEDKFNELNDLLKSKGTWDGGDQGLLNEWRGNNWNRLSFTYNTTPTAAYTYAPAYERFGSEISALHFIGKNKPWNSIAYRVPFTSRSLAASDPAQQAYDYDSLVDRWYAVYDKHYRSEPVAPGPSFRFEKYTSVWDEPNSSSSATPVDSLDLNELKQLAIMGIAVASNHHQTGEGKYISMPIEGRIDLMRPRMQQVEQSAGNVPSESPRRPPSLDLDQEGSFPETPRNHPSSLQPDGFRWHTLPTPQPDELPPSPQIGPVALPPTPTHHRFEPVRSDFYASESESETKGPPLFAPDLHSQDHLAASLRAQADGTFQLAHSRPTHGTRSGVHTPRRSRAASFSQPMPHQDTQHSRSHHSNKQDDSSKRPLSPPLLSWNPAFEPPPNDALPSAFPSDTYFPNIWDHPSLANKAHGRKPETPSVLFLPPPPPEIPESLVKQGHYRAVTGEDTLGNVPSPDRTRIKHVFPWEERPRVEPRRVFPESEALNPPALFLSPGSPSQTSTAAPSTPEQPKATSFPRGQLLSPLFGLPPTVAYANAWDTVPSITKYATKLVRPSQPPPPLAPAFEDERWKKPRKTWDDRLEESGRDGDDEDNADDEDENDDFEDDTKWDESDEESNPPPSKTPTGITTLIKGKKDYRDQAIQATPQVHDQETQAGDVIVAKKIRRSSMKQLSIPGGNFLKPPSTRDAAISTSPLLSTGNAALKRPVRGPIRSGSTSPSFTPNARSPMRSPTREFIVPALAPKTNGGEYHLRPAPQLSIPPARPNSRPLSPNIKSPPGSRQVSNDSSITSPGDSSGAHTPLAESPLGGPVRVSGRVWDPARGVEIFKRGSEEVLARFLKMGSWENETVR